MHTPDALRANPNAALLHSTVHHADNDTSSPFKALSFAGTGIPRRSLVSPMGTSFCLYFINIPAQLGGCKGNQTNLALCADSLWMRTRWLVTIA